MMPNMNPRQMKKMMQQLGMKMDEISADEVIIKKSDGDIVIKNPNVVRMKVQGKDSFQITGNIEEGAESSSESVEVSEDDVKMVMQQANVSEEEAKKALNESNGDLAKAILSLEEK